MKTPIFDFLNEYRKSDTARLHMPGHKGRGELGVERYDITEIDGADNLFSPIGIIAESEENAARLFGTQKTLYSTEGATLAIKAMLAIVAKGKKKARILATGASHKAFMYAAALLDLDVDFIYPKDTVSVCVGDVTAQQIEDTLDRFSYDAVYITSPDYLGNIADIRGIAQACHKSGIPLLVDNAHGAYLKFLSPSRHPIDLGADMCCDSAHKTLSALTGTAYLHISKSAPAEYSDSARDMLALFASTSPSYLLLASLDICNKNLAKDYSDRLADTIKTLDGIKRNLLANNISVADTEPLKIVIEANKIGYTGTAIAGILRKSGIECEFSDSEYTVMMITPENSLEELKRAEEALLSIKKLPPLKFEGRVLGDIKREYKMTVREALFMPSEEISVSHSIGRICAAPTVSCPPAIPIAVSGEVIKTEMIPYFLKYGIEKIKVVK